MMETRAKVKDNVTGWVDISLPLGPATVVWPGQMSVRLDKVADMARGDFNTVSSISLSVHTGTHMDAPCHFVAGHPSIDEMPLEAGVGPARVIEVNDPVSIQKTHLMSHRIKRGERILFKTLNSLRGIPAGTFDKEYVYIDEDAARYLVECGVRFVGLDYYSVAGYNSIVGTHRILLEADIWLVEGLDLRAVPPGNYELVCLPLKIVGCDGSPARAILRPL